jgi:hypothetical protein
VRQRGSSGSFYGCVLDGGEQESTQQRPRGSAVLVCSMVKRLGSFFFQILFSFLVATFARVDLIWWFWMGHGLWMIDYD